MMYFSLLPLLLPLAGILCPPIIATTVLALFISYKTLFLGYSLTFGLPTLCATMVWNLHKKKEKSWILELYKLLLFGILPLGCMLLFILHTNTTNAGCYALYWLIPMGIYGIQKQYGTKAVFFCALQSTFIAHAVGSVMWLYTTPTTPAFWSNLINLVAIERMVFALSTTLFWQSFVWLEKNKLGVLKFIKTVWGVIHGSLHFQNYKKRSS